MADFMTKKTPPHCEMKFERDEFGQEILLKDGRFQVMMEWERPYMQACIDALKPFGDVLEVGFGCGYSASHIQTYHPKSHTIIEYHPVVAKRAREWAKNYPHVVIIEETWQNALPHLGVFDTIFFDDYPLESGAEMQKMKENKDAAHLIIEAGKKKMEGLEKELSFLKEIRYQDEDLEIFFAMIKKEDHVEPKMLLRFFFDLVDQKQITSTQLDKILEKLKQEKELSQDEISRFVEERKGVSTSTQWSGRARGDRLFEFLDACLKSHMRKGSRFSCFLEDSTSKFEDPKFFDLIIVNPSLEYHETRIPIEVPPNCQYYKGDSALVITITKQT